MRIRINNLPADAVKSVNNDELWLTPSGHIYGKDLKGYFELTPYINKCNDKNNHNKYGYYKFHYQNKTYRVHYELARLFVPGFKKGLCVDHRDGNSLNNDISNLEWVTRGENIERFWDSLSEEEYLNYKKIYSEGLKRAHAEGKYKKHLNEIHERRKKNNEDKNL